MICSDRFYDTISASAWAAILPIVYSLLVMAIDRHASQRPECFDLIQIILTKIEKISNAEGESSVLMESSEVLPALMKQGFECLVHLIGTGFTITSLQFLADSVDNLDADVVRHIFHILFTSIEGPFSLIFVEKIKNFLQTESCLKAMKRKENVDLVIRFQNEIMREHLFEEEDARDVERRKELHQNIQDLIKKSQLEKY